MNSLIKSITQTTVQAVVALGAFGAMTYMFINKNLDWDAYGPIAGMAIAWFFRSAVEAQRQQPPSP